MRTLRNDVVESILKKSPIIYYNKIKKIYMINNECPEE